MTEELLAEFQQMLDEDSVLPVNYPDVNTGRKVANEKLSVPHFGNITLPPHDLSS